MYRYVSYNLREGVRQVGDVMGLSRIVRRHAFATDIPIMHVRENEIKMIQHLIIYNTRKRGHVGMGGRNEDRRVSTVDIA